MIVAFVSLGLRVPEEIGVVVEHRAPAHTGHLEIAGRQRVVLAPGRDRREQDDRAIGARRTQRRIRARDGDGDVSRGVVRRLDRRIERRHRRHPNLLSCGQLQIGIQLLNQRRRRVEPFRDGFDRRLVIERRQLGLVHELSWDGLFERSIQVVFGDRVGGDRRFALVAAERLPGLAVRCARCVQFASRLRGRERVGEVVSRLAVDLAAREALAIEQYLKRHVVAARKRANHGRGSA